MKYSLFITRFVLWIGILSNTSLIDTAHSKVDPPNYNFSLKKLDPFTPRNTFASLEKSVGKGQLMEDSGDFKIYRYDVAHIRYKFPVFVQIKKGIITDFYARFPTYFLHDLFHQSLINRFGKQNFYHRQINDAIYIWENVKGLRIIYSGACTVTCFPNYVSYIMREKEKSDFVPIVQKFSDHFKKSYPNK